MDRFLLRIKESFECFKLVSQVLSYLNLYLLNYSGFTPSLQQVTNATMDSLNSKSYGELRKI